MNCQAILISISVCAAFAVCGCTSPPKVRGALIPATSASVSDLKTKAKGDKTELAGTIVEKCPVAGCWFMLKDKTGIVRVDTKAAGFVVSDLPLQTEVKVTGSVVKGDSPSVSATGLQQL